MVLLSSHKFLIVFYALCILHRSLSFHLSSRKFSFKNYGSVGPKSKGRDISLGAADEAGDSETINDVGNVDWRDFRAKLVAQYSGKERENWTEDRWAHDIGQIENGCLLLASDVMDDDTFWQSVILVLNHDPDNGTFGVVLNRPTGAHVCNVADIMPALREAFGEAPLYLGGPMGLDEVNVVHAVEGVEGAIEIRKGLYHGGVAGLQERAEQGQLDLAKVRFEAGHAAWNPGQLEQEIEKGWWYPAVCSPELVVRPCIGLPVPLWCQILDLMGGEYAEIGKKNRRS